MLGQLKTAGKFPPSSSLWAVEKKTCSIWGRFGCFFHTLFQVCKQLCSFGVSALWVSWWKSSGDFYGVLRFFLFNYFLGFLC